MFSIIVILNIIIMILHQKIKFCQGVMHHLSLCTIAYEAFIYKHENRIKNSGIISLIDSMSPFRA